MRPVIGDGELILLRKVDAKRIFPGDIACFRHPDLGLIIKRVTARDRTGDRFRLCSENRAGTETDAIGELPADTLVGRALLRLTPLPRRVIGGSGH